jgi:hypothetical protein
VKVIREGAFAQVGDLVRNGWDTETRSIQPPYVYGVVVSIEPRNPDIYSSAAIAKAPIRSMKVLLCGNGKVKMKYSVHVEVIGESR